MVQINYGTKMCSSTGQCYLCVMAVINYVPTVTVSHCQASLIFAEEWNLPSFTYQPANTRLVLNRPTVTNGVAYYGTD